jgi:hypothetical protein
MQHSDPDDRQPLMLVGMSRRGAWNVHGDSVGLQHPDQEDHVSCSSPRTFVGMTSPGVDRYNVSRTGPGTLVRT